MIYTGWVFSFCYLEFHMDTFFWDFQFAGFGDSDGPHRAVTIAGLALLNLGDNIHALENFAEDNVSSVQPSKNQVSLCFTPISSYSTSFKTTYEVTMVVIKN